MISILPRDYPGTTQESQTTCAKHYRAVMLIITGSNNHFWLECLAQLSVMLSATGLTSSWVVLGSPG